MATIPEAEARVKLQSMPGWTLEGGAIRRQFVFGSFPDAIAFTTRLALTPNPATITPTSTSATSA